MVEQNPWKTPFGKLLAGSAVVALVVGFFLAAGVAGYFRSTTSDAAEPVAIKAEPKDFASDPMSEIEASAGPDIMSDPEGYQSALEQLPASTTASEPVDTSRPAAEAVSTDAVTEDDGPGELEQPTAPVEEVPL